MFYQIRLFLLGLLLVTTLMLGFSVNIQSATALIRQIEEAPGQTIIQSRHTLRDSQGNSWQVVFFQRMKDGEVTKVDLRLVGFPDVITFSHPQPLTIVTDEGQVLQAPDQFAEKSPAPNVGEYDFSQILSQLPSNQSVKLSLFPDQDIFLIIPFAVILEWQAIAK